MATLSNEYNLMDIPAILKTVWTNPVELKKSLWTLCEGEWILRMIINFKGSQI